MNGKLRGKYRRRIENEETIGEEVLCGADQRASGDGVSTYQAKKEDCRWIMVLRIIANDEGYVTPFKKMIDDASVMKNNEKQKVRSSLYASDYGQCMRKVWFQFFPEEFPSDGEIDARTARIFANGNDVHERLGSYMKMFEDIDFVDEINVYRDDLDVHGRCDGVTTLHDQMHILEFKSINKEGLTEPKEEHVGQLTWYMEMFTKYREELRAEFGIDGPMIDEDLGSYQSARGRKFHELLPIEKRLLLSQGDIVGEIIYELKSNQRTVHFPLKYDQDKVRKVRLWFEQVQSHVQEKVRPEVKYSASKYPCSWRTGKCPYFSQCYGDKGANKT